MSTTRTQEQVSAALAAMDRRELEAVIFNVLSSLYADTPDDDTEAPWFFDSAKEWDGDTLSNIAEDIESSGLSPDQISAEPSATTPANQEAKPA